MCGFVNILAFTAGICELSAVLRVSHHPHLDIPGDIDRLIMLGVAGIDVIR